MNWFNYVTYNTAGNLDGGYLQTAIPPDHQARHIIVDSDEKRMNWPMYKPNATFTDVVPIGA